MTPIPSLNFSYYERNHDFQKKAYESIDFHCLMGEVINKEQPQFDVFVHDACKYLTTPIFGQILNCKRMQNASLKKLIKVHLFVILTLLKTAKHLSMIRKLQFQTTGNVIKYQKLLTNQNDKNMIELIEFG